MYPSGVNALNLVPFDGFALVGSNGSVEAVKIDSIGIFWNVGCAVEHDGHVAQVDGHIVSACLRDAERLVCEGEIVFAVNLDSAATIAVRHDACPVVICCAELCQDREIETFKVYGCLIHTIGL